jgi:outer membrane lipoprotein carrier protein
MKTTTPPLAALALALALAAPGLGAPSLAQAQTGTAPSAARVAAQVQSFYDQTRTVQTAFTQAHYDRIYQRTTRARGVLTISKPGKLRFDYLGGDGKVVVSDGARMTVYEPGEGGGAGQYAQTAVREEGIPSALGFLTGEARLDRDFVFRLRDASAFHWDGYVLELTPRAPEPAYRRVFLYVDGQTAGVVRRVLIQDPDGNLNRFDFARMRFNRPVADSRFDFTPPSNARRL